MIRIIGLGSPFGDDRAGWWVAERLRGRLPEGADAITLDRPGAALVNWLQGVDHLILVDAIVDGGPAGRQLSLTPQDLAVAAPGLTSHELAIGNTLDLAARLDCRPDTVEIYGVTIASTGRPSDCVRQAASRLADDIVEHLRVPGSAVVP